MVKGLGLTTVPSFGLGCREDDTAHGAGPHSGFVFGLRSRQGRGKAPYPGNLGVSLSTDDGLVQVFPPTQIGYYNPEGRCCLCTTSDVVQPVTLLMLARHSPPPLCWVSWQRGIEGGKAPQRGLRAYQKKHALAASIKAAQVGGANRATWGAAVVCRGQKI